MKLLNIFLLFGLINNAYSMDHETFLKIQTIWRYFTPEAQKELRPILKNYNGDHAWQDVNPVLLSFILPTNEFNSHVTEEQKIICDTIAKLLVRGDDLRPFIDGILTDKGINFLKNKVNVDKDSSFLCNEFQFLSKYFKSNNDPILNAVKVKKELNKIFNDE